MTDEFDQLMKAPTQEVKIKDFQDLLLNQDKLYDSPSMTNDWDALRQEYKVDIDLMGTGLQLGNQPMQEQNEADVQGLIARQTHILGRAMAFSGLEMPAFGPLGNQTQSGQVVSKGNDHLAAFGEKYSIPIALVDPKAVKLVESYNNAIAKFPSAMLGTDDASEEVAKLRSELTDKYYSLLAKNEVEMSKPMKDEGWLDRVGDYTRAIEDINSLDEVTKIHDGVSETTIDEVEIKSDAEFGDISEEELTRGIYEPSNTSDPFTILDIEPIEAPKQAPIPAPQKRKSKKMGNDKQASIKSLTETHELDDLDAQFDLKVLSELNPEFVPGETKDDRAKYMETTKEEEDKARAEHASNEIEKIALRDGQLQELNQLNMLQAELEGLEAGRQVSGKALVAITQKDGRGNPIPLTPREMAEAKECRMTDIRIELKRANKVDKSGQSKMDRLRSTEPLSEEELNKLKSWHAQSDKVKENVVVNRPNETYIKAVMQLDSWLKPGDAEKLMSADVEVRRGAIDDLMRLSDQYKLSDGSFTAQYFEKNGEKITELALMVPALTRLIQQEVRRNGEETSGDLEVALAQNQMTMSLYQGYRNYTMLKGVKLGDATKEKPSVENAYQAQGLMGGLTANDPLVAEQIKIKANRIVQEQLIENRYQYADGMKQRQKQLHVQLAVNSIGVHRQAKTSTWDKMQYNIEANEMATKVNTRLEEKEKEPKFEEKVLEQVHAVDSQAEIEMEQSARKQVGQINLGQDNKKVFDQKATVEPGYKERKEQKKQRAKAIAKTGSARGVTHLTGKLMDGMDKAELTQRKTLENERAHKDPVADAEYRKTVQARQNSDGSKVAQKEDTPQELALARQLKNATNDLAGWMNEADREMLRSTSSTWAMKNPVMRQRATEAVGRAVKKATEFKLTPDSFSATSFTANAQTITELKRCLTPLQSVALILNMQETPEMQSLKRYQEQFECLHQGFAIFLQNNGVSASGGSYGQGEAYRDASQQNYQKEYGTMLQQNATKLQEAYATYSKSLQGG